MCCKIYIEVFFYYLIYVKVTLIKQKNKTISTLVDIVLRVQNNPGDMTVIHQLKMRK